MARGRGKGRPRKETTTASQPTVNVAADNGSQPVDVATVVGSQTDQV